MSKYEREITLKNFLNTFKESCDNGHRYCFILGAGASLESGIQTGVQLSERWRTELGERYTHDELNELATKLNINDIKPSSSTYFDLYDLRFYPDYKNGYAYIEKEIGNAKPSYGYYPLVQQITNGKNNLVITTNFDSLVEDALFIYSDTRPIAVGHELLANYIDVSVGRPLIAKIHRGLFFDPLNQRSDMKTLSIEWKKVLHVAFQVFTPIVIGYAGGDHSLMDFLRDDSLHMNGMYWCYYEPDGVADEVISLVEKRKGYLVPTRGFDRLMYSISKEFSYENPTKKILERANERQALYDEKYDEFSQSVQTDSNPDSETKEIIISLNADAYLRRGNRYYSKGEYEKAIEDYTKVIELDPKYVVAYVNRGNIYNSMGKYDKAIEDYSIVIELNPKFESAYFNRGNAYVKMSKYGQAIEDYSNVIKLDTAFVQAYNNRGSAYMKMGEHGKAIEDYNMALELNPGSSVAYANRGDVYDSMDEYGKALGDYSKAIELNPKYKDAYIARAELYEKTGKPEKAAVDRAKIEILNK